MSDPQPPFSPAPSPAPTPAGSLARATRWWLEGRELFRRDPALWLGMGLLTVLFALLLKRIPLLGNFMLVLIAPVLLAGAWLTARSLIGVTHVPSPGKDWPARLRFYLGRPVRALTEGFRQEAHILPLIMVCILTLGLVILVSIVELVLTGGSLVSGLKAARLDSGFTVLRLVGLLLTFGLYVLLAMALLFVVPLVILNDRLVVPAIPESFRLSAAHASALGLFVAPFLVPVFLIGFAFGSSATAMLGYLLVLTLGVAALPLFFTGCYACYRELVKNPPSSRTASGKK